MEHGCIKPLSFHKYTLKANLILLHIRNMNATENAIGFPTSTEHQREEFDGHSDVGAATFKCHSICSLTAKEHTELVSIYNRFGFVLVKCTAHSPTDEDIRGNIMGLQPLLGRTAPHKRMDSDGIVPIVASTASAITKNKLSWAMGLTSAEFEPHTDGSFLAVPDEVLSLTCYEPAAEGGESYVVSGAKLFSHLQEVLSAAELAGLFLPDAITVGRDGQTATKPVFHVLPSESTQDSSAATPKLTMSWRCDLVLRGQVHPEAKRGCDAILAFVTDPMNQLTHKLQRNEMLIMDNRAVLHARRSFPDGMPRRLARCNFFLEGEGGAFESHLATGFTSPSDAAAIAAFCRG